MTSIIWIWLSLNVLISRDKNKKNHSRHYCSGPDYGKVSLKQWFYLRPRHACNYTVHHTFNVYTVGTLHLGTSTRPLITVLHLSLWRTPMAAGNRIPVCITCRSRWYTAVGAYTPSTSLLTWIYSLMEMTNIVLNESKTKVKLLIGFKTNIYIVDQLEITYGSIVWLKMIICVSDHVAVIF